MSVHKLTAKGLILLCLALSYMPKSSLPITILITRTACSPYTLRQAGTEIFRNRADKHCRK